MPRYGLLEDSTILDIIIGGVRSGLPLVTAAKRAGVSPVTVAGWYTVGRDDTLRSPTAERGDSFRGTERARYEALMHDFAHRLEVARAEWEAEHFENIAREALGHRNSQPQWKASAWILNNHPDTRRTYRQEKNALEDRRDPLPIYQQVAQLSDNELKALASGEVNPGEPDGD